MKDLQSLVVENIVIWLPALERGQGEFYDAFLMGDGGVEEKYGCVGRKVEAKDWRQRRHRSRKMFSNILAMACRKRGVSRSG